MEFNEEQKIREILMGLSEDQKIALKNILVDEIKNNKEEEEERNRAVIDGKEVQWYSALVNANINTRFELDRNLLILSSLAIGVLVYFIKNITKYYLFEIWLFSDICFLITIFLSLNIFKRNQYLLENIINGKNTDRLDNTLKLMDFGMYLSFILGILSLLVLSILQFDFKSFL